MRAGKSSQVLTAMEKVHTHISMEQIYSLTIESQCPYLEQKDYAKCPMKYHIILPCKHEFKNCIILESFGQKCNDDLSGNSFFFYFVI